LLNKLLEIKGSQVLLIKTMNERPPDISEIFAVVAPTAGPKQGLEGKLSREVPMGSQHMLPKVPSGFICLPVQCSSDSPAVALVELGVVHVVSRISQGPGGVLQQGEGLHLAHELGYQFMTLSQEKNFRTY
jgi:hypothetical protein